MSLFTRLYRGETEFDVISGRNRWFGVSATVVVASLLSLLVFVFEGIRDAFDPRKTFADAAPAEDASDDIEPVAEVRQ